jgi:hypothetical protein
MLIYVYLAIGPAHNSISTSSHNRELPTIPLMEVEKLGAIYHNLYKSGGTEEDDASG